MKRLFQDFIGFLQASRIPNLLVIGLTQYLTAVFLVESFPGKREIITSLGFFALAFSTTMIAAAGYIINDYYDQKIDMINRPDKVVVGTIFRRRMAMLAHFALSVGAIVIGFYLNLKVGFVHIISVFLLWYYSNSLRRVTLIGNFVIAFLTGLTLLLVTIYLERSEILVFVYALFAMAIVLIREVIKDIEDVKGEAAFGCQSLPAIFGIRVAKIFVYVISLGSASMLVSFLVSVNNWLVRYYFLLLLPVFIWFIYRLVVADTQREYKNLVRFTDIIIFSGLVSMIFIKSWH